MIAPLLEPLEYHLRRATEGTLPTGRRIGEEVAIAVSTDMQRAWFDGASSPMNHGVGEYPRPTEPYHRPVMVDEVLRGLEVAEDGTYLDGTLGQGGHSMAILSAGNPATEPEATGAQHSGPSTRVIGIDLDKRSLNDAARRLSHFGGRFTPLQGNYSDMVSLAASCGVREVDGVLLDLGFSSRQVDGVGYGLSFQSNEALDMRYDDSQGLTAGDLVNGSSEGELAGIFRRYGEEPRGRTIAAAIVRERQARPIRTTFELAELVARVSPARRGHRVHPATRVFQALRIAVNGELDNLRAGLDAAVALLRVGGRLAVISYHSLEDRMVKRFLAHQAADCLCPPGLPACVCGKAQALAIVNRRVIRPAGIEIASNPRSRSARLRLARRTQGGG